MLELNRSSAEGAFTRECRLAYSERDMAVKTLLAQRLEALGLHVYSDAIGNLVALSRPLDPRTPFILVGSHLDTTADCDRLGSGLAIAAALEIFHQRIEGALPPGIPLGLVCFACGEPDRFGVAAIGSRYFTGEIGEGELERIEERASAGRPGDSLARVLRERGIARKAGQWETLSLFRGGPNLSLRDIKVAAFVELAAERPAPGAPECDGPTIVSRVAAPVRASIGLHNRAAPLDAAGHGDQAEMAALAMRVWERFDRHCRSRQNQRLAWTLAGMGTPDWRWGAIPETLEIQVEISSTSTKRRNRCLAHLKHLLARETSKGTVSLQSFKVVSQSSPVQMSVRINRALTASARKLGIKTAAAPAMNGRNAVVMAGRHDSAMILLNGGGGGKLGTAEGLDLQLAANAVALVLETVKGMDRTTPF